MLRKEKAEQRIDLDYLNLDFCLTGQEAAACYNEHVTDVTFNGRKRKLVSWNNQDGNYFGPKKSCKPPKNGTRITTLREVHVNRSTWIEALQPGLLESRLVHCQTER